MVFNLLSFIYIYIYLKKSRIFAVAPSAQAASEHGSVSSKTCISSHVAHDNHHFCIRFASDIVSLDPKTTTTHHITSNSREHFKLSGFSENILQAFATSAILLPSCNYVRRQQKHSIHISMYPSTSSSSS